MQKLLNTFAIICVLLSVFVATGAAAETNAPLPLVVDYTMDVAPDNPSMLVDSGPLGYDAKLENVQVVENGHTGSALRFDGKKSVATFQGEYIQKIAEAVTVTFWIKVERFPRTSNLGECYIFSKGPNAGYQLAFLNNRQIFFHAYWGGGWYHGPSGGQVPQNEWAHIAMTMQKGGQAIVYINGKPVIRRDTPFAIWPVSEPMKLGNADWTGLLDSFHLYAAQLTPEQVQADMEGNKLNTKKPTDADFPELKYPVKIKLVRYDMPIGFRNLDTVVKQTAERKPGPDAVDWPRLTLNVPGEQPKPLFEVIDRPEQNFEVPLAGFEGNKNMPLFRQPYDNAIQPVDHWLRALAWRWGQFYIYTTDRTARTNNFEYEIWAFPIKIEGPGQQDIQSVQLSLDGRQIYSFSAEDTPTDALHSLTLLLPANLGGKPYTLSVNGRGPVSFDVGLQPVELGDPKDVPIPVDAQIPGDGPTITVRYLDAPEEFPNQKEWDADMAAMQDFKHPLRRAIFLAKKALTNHINNDVPRSPVSINIISMSAGMTGGQYFSSPHVPGFRGTPQEYAAHLADMGFDRDIETIDSDRVNRQSDLYEQWIIALIRHGIKPGLNASGWSLGNPNMAFYSWNLPEWNAPLVRDYQLLTQRYKLAVDGLETMFTGADNAGYVPYWDWAPPIPNRPWGRAFVQFQQGRPLTVPVGPELRVVKKYERRGTEREFLDYIARYDKTFGQYGSFAKIITQIAPDMKFATGSYGSSPGVGGRGGWPWATIPGEPMHRNLDIQMAYDWNEQSSSKPMHNVALIDRLRSYYPDKTTWSLIDDFALFFGREARQRAYALVLTRGVQAVGTTFLAHDTVITDRGRDRKQVIAEQKELFDWIHRFGGAYSMTEPTPAIGIMYVHEQAISRMIVGGNEPDAQDLYNGSHEGKVTEALFMCHAAGWPAKVITPEELRRGLAPNIEAMLLVGLNRIDDTWAWHDGLTDYLQSFVDRGGRILLDNESVCPVAATATGMRVAAYVTNRTMDWTPELLARNADNITRLRQAMQGVEKPLAYSDDPTIWAVPTIAGNTHYVTVVNQGSVDGQNASQVVKPQIGTLAWRTDRPIYDVRLGRKITAEEAARCDLTHDGFRYYALPADEVVAPTVKIRHGADEFYRAEVTIKNPDPLTGIPVRLDVTGPGGSATVYSATGLAAELPLSYNDPQGDYTITATELLSGQSAEVKLPVITPKIAFGLRPTVRNEQAVIAFANRTKPLTIALMPQQQANAAISQLAQKLADYYRGKGRQVSIDLIAPNRVVRSLQQWNAIQRRPQWHTVDSDLILLGMPSDNILLMDEALGYLLPPISKPESLPETPTISYAWSPFVGKCDVVNILGSDAPTLEAGADALMKLQP